VNTEDRLAKRIASLLDDNPTPELAYPLRARLGRVVHEATLWLINVEGRVLNPQIDVLVSELRSISSHLMQPSEPFDGRWQSQWHEVRTKAQELRLLIHDSDQVG